MPTSPCSSVSLFQGDARRLRIQVADESLGGAIFAGTIASARWWLAKSATSTGADILIKKSLADGGIVLGSVNGYQALIVSIGSADTYPPAGTPIPAGTYYQECEVIDGDGNPLTMKGLGSFTIVQALIPPT